MWGALGVVAVVTAAATSALGGHLTSLVAPSWVGLWPSFILHDFTLPQSIMQQTGLARANRAPAA